MERVEITRISVGFFHMQVCAVNDATDEEILRVCNMKNPSGARKGWRKVVRTLYDTPWHDTSEALPIPCEDYPNRMHILVGC